MTFIEFFTSSRYIGVLEAQLKQQREDYREQLAEKNVTIRQLRVELAAAKSDGEQLSNVPGPSFASVGIPVSTQPNTPQGWQSELNRLLEEEEDGIRSGRRIQKHEPSADDGA